MEMMKIIFLSNRQQGIGNGTKQKRNKEFGI